MMDFFNDFTLYQYYHFENAINIGFCTCDATRQLQLNDNFYEKLAKYLEYPFNPSRGGDYKRITLFGREYTLGYAEMRIIAENGKVFAAPNLIISKIMEGIYTPPAEFVEAVLNGADQTSAEYRHYTDRYNEEHCWGATDEYIAKIGFVCSAIRRGDLGELKAFLRANDQDELVTNNGSLINEAIMAGQESLADYLIECDYSINRFDGVELLTAIECNMERIVEKLLSRKIYIKMDLPRNNPLFFAIAKHKNQIAKRLYEQKPELAITYNTEYTSDCNILMWSKMAKNDEFITFMQNRYQVF